MSEWVNNLIYIFKTELYVGVEVNRNYLFTCVNFKNIIDY